MRALNIQLRSNELGLNDSPAADSAEVPFVGERETGVSCGDVGLERGQAFHAVVIVERWW
jgi:hypothetical protein